MIKIYPVIYIELPMTTAKVNIWQFVTFKKYAVSKVVLSTFGALAFNLGPINWVHWIVF